MPPRLNRTPAFIQPWNYVRLNLRCDPCKPTVGGGTTGTHYTAPYGIPYIVHRPPIPRHRHATSRHAATCMQNTCTPYTSGTSSTGSPLYPGSTQYKAAHNTHATHNTQIARTLQATRHPVRRPPSTQVAHDTLAAHAPVHRQKTTCPTHQPASLTSQHTLIPPPLFGGGGGMGLAY